MVVISIIVVSSYSFFYEKACSRSDYYASHFSKYQAEVKDEVSEMIWVLFLLLAIIFFTVGCIMINRLRTYYKDFYKDFARQLWSANILMTVPLTFRAVMNALTLDEAWENIWFGDDSNYYYWATYNVGFFFIATYIPMLTQIFSLIFGFMRNKKVKIFRSYGGDQSTKSAKSNRNVDDYEDSDDDKSQTSLSLSTNTRNSDNSWFDPPLENYRFFYQAGNQINDSKGSNGKQAAGFVLKQRGKLGSEVASERGKSGLMSSYGKNNNLFGSTVSRGEVVSNRMSDAL